MTQLNEEPLYSAPARPGTPSLSALRGAIERAKGGDPLAPVTVAVPSNYAGLSLRRRLGLGEHRLEGTTGEGLVNVRFMVLARVAEFLGAPALAAQGRRPLTAVARAELARRVLTDPPGHFAQVGEHPATARSLVQTFQELRRSEPAALEMVAAAGRHHDVLQLFQRFRGLASSAYYDEEDLAAAAAEAVAAGVPALRDIGQVVRYGAQDLTPQERRLVAQLAGRGLLTDLTAPPVAPGWSGVTVWAAPDPEEEVRTALRLALQRLERGVPAHRIAVLYPAVTPYALLVDQVFSAAGLAYSGPATETLGHSVTGRFLLLALRLPGRQFSRDQVMEWLTSCPVRDPERSAAPAPAQRWEVLARRAGIVRGPTQWHDRLSDLVRRCEEDRRAGEADGRFEGFLGALAADRGYAERLRQFIDTLVVDLVAPPSATWPVRAGHARKFIDRYLFADAGDPRWSERHQRSHEKVLGMLDELAALPGDAPISDTVFLNALEQQFEAPAGRTGSFGVGVFAGRYRDAAATDFDTVLLLGMNEGWVPQRRGDDPLLPDTARPEGVPRRAPRPEAEQQAFWDALAAGAHRVLLFALADPRAQHARLPSRHLLEGAAWLAGRPVTSDELADRPDAAWPWFNTVASFEAGLYATGLPAASLADRDLASLGAARRAGSEGGHYLWGALSGPAAAVGPAGIAPDWGRVLRGLQAQRARFSAGFTEWDGLVTADGPLFDPDRPVSPTALQNWATCPRRHLFANLLRVEGAEDPADAIAITPLERGALIHRILERFIEEAPARVHPDVPWSEAERDQMRSIAVEECDAAAQRGVTGQPLLWALDRAQLLRDVEGFLDADEEVRRRFGVVTPPDGLELRFGDARSLVLKLPSGKTVRFHGAADRVDGASDGTRALVLDYKTGSDWAYRGLKRGATTAGGKLLQLPVYGLAARQRYPRATVETHYWFVTERGGYQTVGYTLDEARLADFRSVLAAIVEGIDTGVFPANPGGPGGNGPANCRFCPYDRCCPGDRTAVWKRKQGDPRLAGYRGLEGSP